MPKSYEGHLRRLRHEWYVGNAYVFWTHTIKNRAKGWLSPKFHAGFREILVHTLARYYLICPVYCLMPDHFHLIWMGLSSRSDQLAANAFFRTHLHPLLAGARLQRQCHEHVLRESERQKGAVQATCSYILDNPLRADLCSDRNEYPHLGAAVVGYPRLDPRALGYWEKFWMLYHQARDRTEQPSNA